MGKIAMGIGIILGLLIVILWMVVRDSGKRESKKHPLSGSSSGKITVDTIGTAGSYNFNLPTSGADSVEYILTDGGGTEATDMKWTPIDSLEIHN